MKNKNLSFVHTGLPSLLVIFLVLSLVTFAVLSYVSARRDAMLAEKSARRTRLYYEADLSLRQELAGLDIQLKELLASLPDADEAAFLEACAQTFPEYQDGLLTKSAAIGEDQQLTATLVPVLPAAADAPCYQIVSWQVVTTRDWVPDDSLPVYQLP